MKYRNVKNYSHYKKNAPKKVDIIGEIFYILVIKQNKISMESICTNRNRAGHVLPFARHFENTYKVWTSLVFLCSTVNYPTGLNRELYAHLEKKFNNICKEIYHLTGQGTLSFRKFSSTFNCSNFAPLDLIYTRTKWAVACVWLASGDGDQSHACNSPCFSALWLDSLAATNHSPVACPRACPELHDKQTWSISEFTGYSYIY